MPPDKKLKRSAVKQAGVFLVFFAVLNLLAFTWHRQLRRQREENLLHSSNNLAGPDVRDSTPRYDWSTGEAPQQYWRYIPDATKTRLVVLCGMSQMYAINDEHSGDLTISENLDDVVASREARIFGLAAPNLTTEEALLLLLALLERPETTPKVFIYGLCFDKFRNIDLRRGYEKLLTSHSGLQKEWKFEADRWKDLFPAAAEKMEVTLNTQEDKKEQTDQGLEGVLRHEAARALPLVAARTDLNVQLQMQLFLLRNWVFDVKTSSKRPIIKSRYEMNQQFLEMIIRIAKEHGVTPVMYVIPLNPIAENPYIPSEYAAFKRWAETLAGELGVPFANLESAVPHDDWGEFMGGPDFKHFKESGHQRTAAELLRVFGTVMTGAEGQKK